MNHRPIFLQRQTFSDRYPALFEFMVGIVVGASFVAAFAWGI